MHMIVIMKLKTYMMRCGLSDTEMGRLVKVDRTTINRIRRGKQLPSWQLMLSIQSVTEGKVLPNDYIPEN